MKKIISILAVTLLSLMTAVAASAAPNVAVGNVTAEAGSTINVEVVLSGNEKFNSLGLEFTYDKDVFTLLNATDNQVTGLTANLATLGFEVYPYNISWTAPARTPSTYNGTVTTLTFQVAADAEPGEYEIGVDYYKGPTGAYVDGKNVNFVTVSYKPQALGLTYTDGSITIPGGEVETTLAAAKDGNTVSITATAEEFSGKFIIAAYNGNELAEVIVKDAAASESATITAAYDDVKVMWWDSLTGLTSIAPAVDL